MMVSLIQPMVFKNFLLFKCHLGYVHVWYTCVGIVFTHRQKPLNAFFKWSGPMDQAPLDRYRCIEEDSRNIIMVSLTWPMWFKYFLLINFYIASFMYIYIHVRLRTCIHVGLIHRENTKIY